ncbi:MAG: hypothetical protein M5R40_21715 [Anaerolineae bacterium]|nr:hypothetical protein [Anaerolineae bacterium]
MNFVPPYPVDPTNFDIPELQKFAVQALAEVELGYNIDVLTPSNFNKTMFDGFQAVLLGQRTPEEIAAQLQADMEAYRAEQSE